MKENNRKAILVKPMLYNNFTKFDALYFINTNTV